MIGWSVQTPESEAKHSPSLSAQLRGFVHMVPFASAAIAAERVLLDSACDAHGPLPENLLDWRALRPTKCLKAKSSLDYLAAKGELAAGSG